MMLTIRTVIRSSLLMGMGLATWGGCATQDFFPSAPSDSTISQATHAQAAAGAREDATLQPYHFEGAKLNSLGMDKLSLLVPNQPDSDVIVYLNLKSGDATAARRDAVSSYLKQCGVEASRVKLETGPNPHADAPSAVGLARLDKTESGTSGGSPADASGGNAQAPGAKPEMK